VAPALVERDQRRRLRRQARRARPRSKASGLSRTILMSCMAKFSGSGIGGLLALSGRCVSWSCRRAAGLGAVGRNSAAYSAAYDDAVGYALRAKPPYSAGLALAAAALAAASAAAFFST